MLAELDKPVVAAVNGIAAGTGMNSVLAADLAVTATDAAFSQSFGHVGLIPDVGGTYPLPRIAGVSKAKEIIFTDQKLDAHEALSQACPPASLCCAAPCMARTSGESIAED